MLKISYLLPNGKSFAHVSRSGTSTIAAHALRQFYPEQYAEFLSDQKEGNAGSPQSYLPESWSNRLPSDCVCMVREPEDRLKSMIARNPHYTEDDVTSVLNISNRVGTLNRNQSKQMGILKFLHLAPICNIAENDSKLILWPNIEEACKELGLEYDPAFKFNALKSEAVVRYEGINLFDDWKQKLTDSTLLWKALNKH